jgi:hypothetical protein
MCKKTDSAYAFLVHTCLLYWCVPPHVLGIRRSLLNKSKYMDVLTAHALCTGEDWTTKRMSLVYA